MRNSIKNLVIAAAFLFSASAFAGVDFNCVAPNGTATGTLNDDGSGVISLNGQSHAATGEYKVYPQGTYCYHSDVFVMNVIADDHSVGISSIRGDTCGGEKNGDLVIVDGNRQSGTCTIIQD